MSLSFKMSPYKAIGKDPPYHMFMWLYVFVILANIRFFKNCSWINHISFYSNFSFALCNGLGEAVGSSGIWVRRHVESGISRLYVCASQSFSSAVVLLSA